VLEALPRQGALQAASGAVLPVTRLAVLSPRPFVYSPLQSEFAIRVKVGVSEMYLTRTRIAKQSASFEVSRFTMKTMRWVLAFVKADRF
jgi:hypothetical protein